MARLAASCLKRVALALVVVFDLGSADAAQTRAPSSGEQPNQAAARNSDLVSLGTRYEHGESVPQDYRRALALYCQAARGGEPAAFFNLGWMYLNGRGVARDDATAAMWFRKAAEHGVAQATNLLNLLPRAPAGRVQNCPANGVAAVATMAPVSPAIRALVEETAQDVGISANLLLSVISIESNFNPRAVSPKMAAGLMQLMPETAIRYNVRDSFDERENVHAGAVYLRDLLRMFNGDLTLALAAYNAGEAAVLSHGGVPPYKETIDYVAAVKRLCACGQ